MSSKTIKQTKANSTKVEKADDYNEKEIQSSIETLVNKVVTHTLRGTSLDAKVPDDPDTAEKLYQQYRVGFSFLSQMDDYIAGIVDQLARGMQRLTENRFKQTIDIEQEPEPPADENIVDNQNSNEVQEVTNQEEKKSTKKKDKKESDDEDEDDDEEEEPEVKSTKKGKTPTKVSKHKEPEPESESEPEEEVVKPKKGDKKSKKSEPEPEPEVKQKKKGKEPEPEVKQKKKTKQPEPPSESESEPEAVEVEEVKPKKSDKKTGKK